ncbi:MAG: hypothetical protein AAF438_10290 [Pseudomonadota bacterium]
MHCPTRLALVILLVARPVVAIELEQTDDFQDGTTQSWVNDVLGNSTNPPVNTNDGTGITGVGDRFLTNVSTGGSGVEGEQLFLNTNQWSGDYLDADVDVICGYFRNRGATDLRIHLGVEGASTQRFVSTTPFALPADGQWRRYIVSIRRDDVTSVGIGGTYDGVFSAVTQLRIFHRAGSLGWQPTPVAGSVDVDNITAGNNSAFDSDCRDLRFPIANAGTDQTIIDWDNNGVESVTLDGSQSLGFPTIISYQWSFTFGNSFDPGRLLATGSNPTLELARGSTRIALRTITSAGFRDDDIIRIFVVGYDVADVAVLPDFTGDSLPDIASLKYFGDQPGGFEAHRVSLYSSAPGFLTTRIGYGDISYAPVSMVAFPQSAPDGGTALGVFSLRINNNSFDGNDRIEIRDPDDGSLISIQEPLNDDWQVRQILSVPSVGQNGSAALGVLAVDEVTRNIALVIREVALDAHIRTLFFLGSSWTPLHAEIIPNLGSGEPGVALLATRDDGLSVVQIRNTQDGALTTNVFSLDQNWSAIEMRVINDATGDAISDLAIRSVRNSDGLEVIQIRNSVTGALVRNLFPLPAPWVTHSMAAVDDNGSSALAVMAERTSDGQMLAQVRNTTTGTLINNTYMFGSPWRIRKFMGMADLDASGTSDLLVLAQNQDNGRFYLQIRDAATGIITRNLPQPP